MKEFIDKLIAGLDKKIHLNPVDEYERGYSDASCDAIDDINELAEEYNNGWIACSERLPEKSGKYIVTQKIYSLDRFNKKLLSVKVDYVDFDANTKKWSRASFFEIIAWQPLPKPYRKE